MARARRQRGGGPCIRPPCGASGPFGEMRARASSIAPILISDAWCTVTTSPSLAMTPTWTGPR
eukprot:10810519-Alexandrium_andersonii.AAC.1